MDSAPVINAYMGTYTRHGESQGIYLCHFDRNRGALQALEVCDGIADPSYLVLSPDGSHLYAASEKTDASEICAYRIQADGRLLPHGRITLPAQSVCHLACHPSGKVLVGSGYRSGNVLSLALNPDGSLGRLVSNVVHAGQSVHPVRQTAPHVHSAAFSPDGRHALVCDLGTDRIYAYAVCAKEGTLSPAAHTPVATGQGPRHMAFSGDGCRLYAVTELGNQVLTYLYEGPENPLRLLDVVSTLDAGFAGQSTAADIHLSPDERFLYVSNRGADDIACFALDTQGLPKREAAAKTGGKTPRHFVIASDGRFLLAANQDSGSVRVFARDLRTGALVLTDEAASVPFPSCVLLREGA